MKGDEAKRLRELEKENVRLKKLRAEAELDKTMLKELASGNGDARASPAARDRVHRSRRRLRTPGLAS